MAQSDADGSFSYTLDAKNESNTWVDEFTITDDLECAKEGTAKLIAIETPVATGDIDGLCNVWYRTSPVGSIDTGEQTNATLSAGHDNPWLETDEVKKLLGDDLRMVDYGDWRLWKADIPTTESVTLEGKRARSFGRYRRHGAFVLSTGPYRPTSRQEALQNLGPARTSKTSMTTLMM